MKIGLFITCLTDMFMPRAGVAVVKVLEHLGHTVEFPREQTCCGQPMFNNGLEAEARALACRLATGFAPFDAVVTPSGSCAAMVRERFPGLLAGVPDLSDRAVAMPARTYEFVEFLTDVLRLDAALLGARWEGRATHHPSCHLRALHASDRTRRLLSGVAGLELAPLVDAEQCCGFGGTFAVAFPRLSGAMAHAKAERVRDTGCQNLVCNDAGCAMNIAGACRRGGSPVQILSAAEIIAEGLGLMERDDHS
jgi:L-lactate dehydrogenase complex protein LldE